MRYHSHTPTTDLVTPKGPMQYPARWELFRWYHCLRKYPYPTEAIAYLSLEGRGEEYSHFPCRVNPEHWHVGRGHNDADPKKLTQRAKRAYRKAEREEIRSRVEEANRVVREEEKDCG